MSHNISAINILRDAFPGIQEEETIEIVGVGKLHIYPKDTVLCHEGGVESIFYILLDGKVDVTKVMSGEENRLMKHLETGAFFGEMALLHNAPRAATVRTTTPVTVLEIHKEEFAWLLERNTSVSLAIMREVSRRLRENDEMAIEELRIKARELADAYQQLAEMECARNEFLTTIAHELRTPLTAAGGFLHLIQSGILQGEVLDSALDTVGNNIQSIISLTNDILFLQEMELILPDFQPTDVGGVVASAVEQYRSRAQANGVGMQVKIAPGLPKVLADARTWSEH